MDMSTPTNCTVARDAHLVAHAALVLAERAYADGNAQEAERLVDVAHRLFDAMLDARAPTISLPN